MGKYSTEQAAGAQRIETLGGGYALKWDDETLMGVNAHAALLKDRDPHTLHSLLSHSNVKLICH